MIDKSPWPSRFRLYIGGAPFEPSYTVEMEGRILSYRARSGEGKESEQKISPRSEQWESFWTALERAGVWRWKARYPNPGVLDGTLWSVDIEHLGRAIASQGDNAFPKRFGALLEAVSGLLGGLPFE